MNNDNGERNHSSSQHLRYTMVHFQTVYLHLFCCILWLLHSITIHQFIIQFFICFHAYKVKRINYHFLRKIMYSSKKWRVSKQTVVMMSVTVVMILGDHLPNINFLQHCHFLQKFSIWASNVNGIYFPQIFLLEFWCALQSSVRLMVWAVW